jgi:hypothetical protein
MFSFCFIIVHFEQNYENYTSVASEQSNWLDNAIPFLYMFLKT